MDEHLKDYLAIMEQDAHMKYADEHEDDLPDKIEFDERAKADAEAVVKAFYEAFPDSETEGGVVYLERVYGDEVAMPKAEREWLKKNWWTDASTTIGESVEGGLWIFFE